MKIIFASFFVIFTVQSFAVDTKQFCTFLLTRAEIDPKTQLNSHGTENQINELMEIMGKANNFLDLAKTGVDRKMTWDAFKKFAKSKGVELSNYYQPQYDGMYLNKYCGKAKSETVIQVDNGVTKRSTTSASFELNPNPAEHEYSKQITTSK